ncbi:Abi family protein [Xanthomonas oryzae]|uniref:Abi family protein n=1 Tax=Xanthomonas oryzae TaxID=347 RepID=UPI000DDD7D0D|nr:Abi family protein [Xanthomonas oryzae]RBJ36460.1 Abi family protein [Xanthomonas oryzae pv. oryzae]
MRTFDKAAIPVDAQLDLLAERGLSIQDRERAKKFLEVVSYFRLSAYMRPFQTHGHAFVAGARFQQVTQLYVFDQRLRLLVMEAIERVEVAMRALLGNHMGPTHGAHWYLQRNLFKDRYGHEKLLESIQKRQNDAVRDYQRESQQIDRLNASASRKSELKRRRAIENYARHYALNYNTPPLMPGWAALEELTLGELSHLYQGLARDIDRKQIARSLGLHAPLLESWLHALTSIRNICAHHSRLWNRELGIRPALPAAPDFAWPHHLLQPGHHARMFPVLCILALLLRQVSPDTRWDRRLLHRLNGLRQLDTRQMGFPENWQTDPFWPQAIPHP